jgi:hypothetical protein
VCAFSDSDCSFVMLVSYIVYNVLLIGYSHEYVDNVVSISAENMLFDSFFEAFLGLVARKEDHISMFHQE